MVALAPYLAGIVIVIGRTLLIHLFESSLGRLTLDDVITAGLNALYTVLNRAMDEEIELIREVTQYMVCTAADNNTRGILCHLADDIGLSQIQLIGQAHAVQTNRTEHRQRVQEAVGGTLVELLEQLFVKSGLFSRTGNQFPVLERNAQTERQFLTDLTTTGTIFTTNSNNQVVIHNAPSLPTGIIQIVQFSIFVV